MIGLDDRFAINAALERLVADGTTFDPADASVLIDRVPLSTSAANFGFRMIDQKPRGGMEGHAAGHGNTPIEDGRPKVVEKNSTDVARVGGFKLWHKPGRIHIGLMWSDTKLGLDADKADDQSAVLYYNRWTKRPRALKRPATVPLRIVFWPKPLFELILKLDIYVAWKTPVAPGGTGGTIEAIRSPLEDKRNEQRRPDPMVAAGATAC